MARKKSEKIKIYIGLALVLVLVVNGYFQFLHRKTQLVQGKKGLSPGPKKAIEPSKISIQKPKIIEALGNIPEELIPFSIRNIFGPLKAPTGRKKEEKIPEAPPAPPSFKLKGTIAGGIKPIAIIDDQFVHLGDWIKDYQVVMIGKKKVRLDSGMKEIVLEIMKNE